MCIPIDVIAQRHDAIQLTSTQRTHAYNVYKPAEVRSGRKLGRKLSQQKLNIYFWILKLNLYTLICMWGSHIVQDWTVTSAIPRACRPLPSIGPGERAHQFPPGNLETG